MAPPPSDSPPSQPGDGVSERDLLKKLRRLCRELVPNNRFWAPRLREAGLTNGPATLADFSDKLPLLTKAELLQSQREEPPYGLNLTEPARNYTRFCQTSATSGNQPLICLDTPQSWQWMLENWMAVYHAAGAGSGSRVFFAFSFGPFLGFWTAFEAATQMGALAIPGGGFGSLARLELMRRHQADFLCCTPTYALRLAEVARAEGFDLSEFSLKKIIVAGEPGGSLPEIRKQARQAFAGAEFFDHYGMTEVGPVAYEDPAQPGDLALVAGRFYAEVLDRETGKPVTPGQSGELVLTTLGRSACPLLRYRTGDLVTLSERSRLPGAPILAGGILARADDMVIVRGVNLYPGAVDELVRSVGGVAEYQVEIDERPSLPQVTIRLAATEPDQAAALCQRVTALFHQTYGLRVSVVPVPAQDLPSFELKARRWKRIGD